MRRIVICLAVLAAIAGGCNCNDKKTTISDGGDGGSPPPPNPNDPPGGGCQFNCPVDGRVPVIPLIDGGFGTVGDGGPGTVTGTGDGVVGTDAGVTLGTVTFQGHFAWIADTARGYVSKFDTRHTSIDGGLSEVGRYYSGIPVFSDGGTLYPDGGTAFVRARYAGRYGNSPSRTVIDNHGDMWVGNRAPDMEIGSVTKISSNSNTDPALSGCIDRNGDGFIQTSRDVNGNGIIDENLSCLASDMNDAGMLPGGRICEWINPPADDPDLSHYDECVLFSSEVGMLDTNAAARSAGETQKQRFCCEWVKARGVAVSGGVEAGSAGSIWVVHHHDHRVYKFNGDTGAPAAVAPGQNPWVDMQFGGYGAIVDSQERLYVVRDPSYLAFAIINTTDGTVMNPLVDGQAMIPSATSNYGIGIDGKNRLWIAGWNTLDKSAHAYRYTHPTGTAVGMTGELKEFTFDTARSQIGTSFGTPRGIAADIEGYVWMSADSYRNGGSSAQVLGFNAEDGSPKRFVFADGGSGDFMDVTKGKGSVYDATGLNLATSIGVALDTDNNIWVGNFTGTVMKMNRDTGDFSFNSPDADPAFVPPAYYSYSDFTGYELRNFTNLLGSYSIVITGCDTGNERWDTLTWDATTPPTTAITATVRSSNTTNFATAQPFTFTNSPASLQAPPGPVPPGRYLQVVFTLTTKDRTVRPTLSNVQYTATCLTQALH